MSAKKHSKKLSSTAMVHLNELLDEALEETFPASDPVSINVEMESPAAQALHHTPFEDTRKRHRSAW
jgi:hypothetical protein